MRASGFAFKIKHLVRADFYDKFTIRGVNYE